MAQDFYPFVDNGENKVRELEVRHPARIAVYDDPSAAPRVVVVEPRDVRGYLEEITLQVTQLAQGQGGTIPFMVIREIVENLIHAYFMEPTISILDHGNTIRFSDQGPGIREKERALLYGTTSATEEMRRYIRGVGSGLPYAQQYMQDKGGSLVIDDNMAGGTVVTISTSPSTPSGAPLPASAPQATPQAPYPYQPAQQPFPSQGQPYPQQGQYPVQGQPSWPQQQMVGYGVPPQQMWPQGYGNAYPPQPGYAPWPYQQPQYGYQQQQGMVPAPPAPYQGSPLEHREQAPAPTWPALTERGRAIVDYLSTHESVGPSDLYRELGESQPTWSRELRTLEEQGVVRKDGQKRRLTAMGQALLG